MKATKLMGHMTRDEMMARVAAAAKHLPPIWTIYDHPRDIPGAFVVRCWYGEVAHPDVFLTQDVEHARHYCRAKGAGTILPRQSLDDDAIIESWI